MSFNLKVTYNLEKKDFRGIIVTYDNLFFLY